MAGTCDIVRSYRDFLSADVQRIHDMIALFESDGCLAVDLSGHFGETVRQPGG